MLHILIIDDDRVTCLLLQRVLEQQGYRVTVAANGQTGIELAQSIQPALVICDWMMPIMDGIQVCRTLKADPSLSTTFFILLTSRGDLEDRIKGLNAGADEFLNKPIDANELKARVRAGLRLYQLNQDLSQLNLALQQETQRLEQERAEAADYVRSILPDPMESPCTIRSRFVPSSQLGGDCFDYFWITPESLVLYLLDVSGHGLKSALSSVQILQVLRSRGLGADYQNPQAVLEALNRLFAMEEHDYQYFTIWYGVYQPAKEELVYASAGHPPALLIGESQPVEAQLLKTKGLPIGMFAEAEYCCDRISIPTNSTLYLFSDGIYEILQPDGQIWGFPAFAEALKSFHSKGQPSLDTILDQTKTRCIAETFSDDLSLLQIHFTVDQS
ncbi:MAG: SpoIIE family protein phosphatase [Cyanobacteria bacterium P01_A01_bin.17]